jgi:hypothetical protein
MKTTVIASFLSLAPLSVSAHGMMTLPTPRTGGNLKSNGEDCTDGGPGPLDGHGGRTCGWFTRLTQLTMIGQEPTICDPNLLTTSMRKREAGGCNTPDNNVNLLHRPWRYPGRAKVWSPCGLEMGWLEGDGGASDPNNDFAHKGPQNPLNRKPRDGRDLPATPRTEWVKGTYAKVGFSVSVNHGGGYNWRICPASATQSESCFHNNALKFATDTHTIRRYDGTTVKVPAMTTTQGTFPSGTEWRMNPIPCCGTDKLEVNPLKKPCSWCHNKCGGRGDDCGSEDANWDFSIIDRVIVPDVPVGDYTLSWRWDNENQDQVWTNCADIKIVKALSANQTLYAFEEDDDAVVQFV